MTAAATRDGRLAASPGAVLAGGAPAGGAPAGGALAGQVRADDGGRSRVTAVVRLALAVWLMWAASQVLLEPGAAAERRGAPADAYLALAGLRFAIGMFLLTGFMCRVAGLLLLVLGVWEVAALGVALEPLVLGALGVYLLLRGGGAWAMDVYVQKMQDRVRLREARERAAAEAARLALQAEAGAPAGPPPGPF